VFKAMFLEEDYQVKLINDQGDISPDWFPAVAKGGNMLVIKDHTKMTPEALREDFAYTIAEKK
jgi:hypothetical protein